MPRHPEQREGSDTWGKAKDLIFERERFFPDSTKKPSDLLTINQENNP